MWVKVSDDIHLNEKILSVTSATRWLYIAATAHSRNQQLGGHLTPPTLRSLVAGQGITYSAVKALVEAGLFEMSQDGGIDIHHYEEYNPPSSKERVRKHRRVKKDGDVTVTVTPSNGPSNSISNPSETPPHADARALGIPNPVPNPVDLVLIPSNLPKSPPVDQDYAELGQECERVMGRILGQEERDRLWVWLADWQYLTAFGMAAVLSEVKAKFGATGDPLRTIFGAEKWLRAANDWNADRGRPKRGDRRASTDTGMAELASTLLARVDPGEA